MNDLCVEEMKKNNVPIANKCIF